jgi:hypothetical protein
LKVVTVKHAVKVLVWAVVLALSLGAGQEAVAHHSFAMFDKTRFLTIKGTVRKIEWANPHAYLHVEVPEGNGESKQYSIECSSPNELSRWGWKINTVKVGDQVTVALYPLRNGERGGLLFSVTLANGTVLKGN